MGRRAVVRLSDPSCDHCGHRWHPMHCPDGLAVRYCAGCFFLRFGREPSASERLA